CIEGMAEACNALDYPVISGNVSLYNETSGQAILPTPTIGGVGLILDWQKAMGLAFKETGETIIVLGETKGHLGQSIFLRDILGREEGTAPAVDLLLERRMGEFVRTVISQDMITACHDISDGGLLIALAEMAMASGIGAEINATPEHEAGYWFGEDQARYVITTRDADAILKLASSTDIKAEVIGKTAANDLKLTGGRSISVKDLKTANEAWLPDYMNGKN
ncbi:MAG: AIR synthase-related protein, partial [Pseudomonadota bacterium]|nr:AIR synthase-related protein [Pseudomonadota bacterium]